MQKARYIFEFDALGTHWWIENLDGKISDVLQKKIHTRVHDFENAYSRFLPKSLLSQLSTTGLLLSPPQEMIDMLAFAKSMHTSTDGVFDIAVGSHLERLGYGEKNGRSHVIDDTWEALSIGSDAIRLSHLTTLDFGGFGKGWLIDEITKLIKQNGVQNSIVNGGGDMFVSSMQPIEIALEHPIDEKLTIGSTYIANGALAVSSPHKRSWVTSSGQNHHIINPKTGESSNTSVASVFVLASTTKVADVIATVLCIDPKLEKKLCELFGVKVIIVRDNQL